MSWWQLLLWSLGGYTVVGIVTSVVYCYYEGRQNRSTDYGEAFGVGSLWPLCLIAAFVCSIGWLTKQANRYGSLYPERKEARREQREDRRIAREVKRTAEELGIPAKNLK